MSPIDVEGVSHNAWSTSLSRRLQVERKLGPRVKVIIAVNKIHLSPHVFATTCIQHD
jgi:hypothetical protein